MGLQVYAAKRRIVVVFLNVFLEVLQHTVAIAPVEVDEALGVGRVKGSGKYQP